LIKQLLLLDYSWLWAVLCALWRRRLAVRRIQHLSDQAAGQARSSETGLSTQATQTSSVVRRWLSCSKEDNAPLSAGASLNAVTAGSKL